MGLGTGRAGRQTDPFGLHWTGWEKPCTCNGLCYVSLTISTALAAPTCCTLASGTSVRICMIPPAGDVLLHTVTDALLGALCLPDIGEQPGCVTVLSRVTDGLLDRSTKLGSAVARPRGGDAGEVTPEQRTYILLLSRAC